MNSQCGTVMAKYVGLNIFNSKISNRSLGLCRPSNLFSGNTEIQRTNQVCGRFNDSVFQITKSVSFCFGYPLPLPTHVGLPHNQSTLLKPIKMSSNAEQKEPIMTCIKELLRRRFANQSAIDKHRQQIMSKGLPKKREIPDVKHIVLVASGKGGVGKSTTAVNMATALADIQPTLRVGLLDADVFGPSIPLMMNLSGKPLISEEKKMIPMVNYGVKCISMGFLVEPESAVVWRGLMVTKAINQLLFEVDWGPTDVLIVDTPPGTGDTHLSLIQNLVISGGLIVTTPQLMARQVARRGVTMYRKMGVPIIGVVQNMGTVVCSNCNHKNDLFGPVINKFAEELDIDVVQDIPLHPDISTSGDQGTPVVISHPDSVIASSFRNLASTLAKFLKIGNFAKEKL